MDFHDVLTNADLWPLATVVSRRLLSTPFMSERVRQLRPKQMALVYHAAWSTDAISSTWLKSASPSELCLHTFSSLGILDEQSHSSCPTASSWDLTAASLSGAYGSTSCSLHHSLCPSFLRLYHELEEHTDMTDAALKQREIQLVQQIQHLSKQEMDFTRSIVSGVTSLKPPELR